MTASVSRRHVLLSLAAACAAGLLPAVDDSTIDEPDRTYPELAGDLARMELRAIRSSHPSHWQRLNYTGLIPFDASTVLFYGVGRPEAVEDDAAALLAYLCQGPKGEDTRSIAGAHRTPCGRAWAVFVDRAEAGECVVDRSQRQWRQETLLQLQAFDEVVGRRPRTCAL
jgi:hypothetical protein